MFQFQHGEIKRFARLLLLGHIALFQFQHGEIKSRTDEETFEREISFNSSMERLKEILFRGKTNSGNVSIPAWRD